MSIYVVTSGSTLDTCKGTDPFERHARMEAAMSQISPNLGAKIRNPSFALGLSNPVVASGNSPVRRQKFRYCLMARGTRMDTQRCLYLIRASATGGYIVPTVPRKSPITTFRPILSGKVEIVIRVRPDRVAYHHIG
jgi:hypothetical protein